MANVSQDDGFEKCVSDTKFWLAVRERISDFKRIRLLRSMIATVDRPGSNEKPDLKRKNNHQKHNEYPPLFP